MEWFRRCGRDLPWRNTNDPYAITVSEFMLQQTRVSVVVDYFLRWMEKFPSVQALAAASENDVLSIWQGLGYYSRARNLHRLAKWVVENYDGSFPSDLEKLRALPGVGDYTAAAIRAFAFDLPAAVIDGNVARVLTRWADYTGAVDSAGGKSFLHEFAMAHQVDDESDVSARVWNSAVMELGALLCTSGQPDCLLCPVREECRAENPAALPVKKPRTKTTSLVERRALIIQQDKVWLEQSNGPRWRGLWILPELGAEVANTVQPLCTVDYPITRYRISMEVIPLCRIPTNLQAELRAHELLTLETLPIAAPHRRAVAQALEIVHSMPDA